MNVKNVVFFNHWRNGDCFINRNYVKEIIDHFHDAKIFYAHDNHRSILQDLKCEQIPLSNIPREIHFRIRLAHDQKDTLFINTWIGTFDGELFKSPQHANFIILYNAWKSIFNSIGMKIKDDFSYYHPTVDYTKFDLTNAIRYIKSINNKKIILVCNGKHQSEQSMMGDMSNIIQNITSEFSDREFLVCDKVNVKSSNITFTDDLFGDSIGNLNHISYLSTFADLIIGKNSGPFSYSHVKENMNNHKKTFLCFSKDMTSTLMGDGKYYANPLFSNTTDDTIATDIIRKVINHMPFSEELKSSVQI